MIDFLRYATVCAGDGPCLGSRRGPSQEYEWQSYRQVSFKSPSLLQSFHRMVIFLFLVCFVLLMQVLNKGTMRYDTFLYATIR